MPSSVSPINTHGLWISACQQCYSFLKHDNCLQHCVVMWSLRFWKHFCKLLANLFWVFTSTKKCVLHHELLDLSLVTTYISKHLYVSKQLSVAQSTEEKQYPRSYSHVRHAGVSIGLPVTSHFQHWVLQVHSDFQTTVFKRLVKLISLNSC
jgi:hypothetical protein